MLTLPMSSQSERQPDAVSVDPRWAAFRSPMAKEVFHSVCQKDQIWRLDTLDVHDIHEDARGAFYELLEHPVTSSGRILLMQGAAGSGKTHLMRAFRNHVHESGSGFCGYMQMTSATSDYGRYVLANLIDSLNHPYWEPDGDRSGLMKLSDLIVESTSALGPGELQRIREQPPTGEELAAIAARFADGVILKPGCERLDPDLLQALFYLQPRDSRVHSRVQKYLRCEPLNEADRRFLPGLEPRLHDYQPLETIERLGLIMAAMGGKRLVLLVDQLEEMVNLENNQELAEVRFRRAMSTLCQIVGGIPASVGVIGCLENLYEGLAVKLTASIRDRLENDPPPVKLVAYRNDVEIRKLVSRRLQRMYEAAGVPNADPLFPFDEPFVRSLTGLSIRDVLDRCRQFREVGPTRPPDSEAIRKLSQAWNDFRTSWVGEVPETEERQAEVLAWAVEQCGADLSPTCEISADRDRRELVVGGIPSLGSQKLRAAVCNGQRNGLTQQVKRFLQDVADHLPVVVRSAEFPTSPRTQIAKLLGEVVTRGGTRIIVEDAHWRQILAFQAFLAEQSAEPAFVSWRQADQPLASLMPLRTMLRIGGHSGPSSEPAQPGSTPKVEIKPTQAAKPRQEAKGKQVDTKQVDGRGTPVAAPSDSSGVGAGGTLGVGTTRDVRQQPVTLTPRELTQHAAFLGGTGSGKTTVALHLIEQLLLEGVPAVLVDRKGDLCGYADLGFSKAEGENAEFAERRRQLRNRVAVTVYTPGESRGNPLAIPLAPADMRALTHSDREAVAQVTAESLAGMMGYRRTAGGPSAKQSILKQAILTLGAELDRAMTVRDLADFVGNQDPELMKEISWFDPKLCRKLAQDLQAVEIQYRALLSTGGPQLDVAQLFARSGQGGDQRTRLSIISTKFLRDPAAVQFWVAQFLVAVERWTSSRPSGALQGVILFDEADIYLPATRQPATKGPMESLLKRARSAGLGLFLATQSPGDLDYKCRENLRAWFLGRIKEDTALRKLKAAFADRPELVTRLGAQQTGEFVLVRDGDPTPLTATRSALETRQLSEEQILTLSRNSP